MSRNHKALHMRNTNEDALAVRHSIPGVTECLGGFTRQGGPGVANADRADVIAAKDLLSSDVYDCGMRRHGRIRNLLLDAQTGEISSAVLAYGGFLGLGEQRITVPWRSLGFTLSHQTAAMPALPKLLRITLGPDRFKWLDVALQSSCDTF